MNKYSTKTITYQGITDTIAGHALRRDISAKTAYCRISRLGGFEQLTPDDLPAVFGSASMKARKGRGRSHWAKIAGWVPINPDMRPMPYPMV